MATTDSSEWRLFDTDLTTQKNILPTDKSHLYYVINEPGSGLLSIPLDSAAAADVTSGQFAMSYYRGSSRNGFFIDNIKLNQADMSEGGGRWVSLSGRGALALLEDAIVWDNGSTETTRTFTNVTKAYILKTLIDEAKARGGLTVLTYDFSATVDSSAVSWTDSEDYSFNVGMTVLDVLRKFAKTGIDFDINYSAGTFVLSAYKNGLGTDKSETVYFRVGVNCVEVGSDERGDDIHNAYRVAYKAGNLTVTDNTSITNRRRREKLLDARLAQTSTSASTYGAAILANSKDPQKGITVKIYDGVGPRVFEDYIMGDRIMLDVMGVETSYRILGIQCDFDGSQYSNVVVELNSLLLDNELRLTQDVEWLKNEWTTAHDAGLLETRFWAAIGDVQGTVVQSMAVSDSGILYVGGLFTEIANVSANNIAAYDIKTGTWSAIGTGMNGRVRSIVPLGSAIYIGGDFTDANGVSVAYVTVLGEGTDTFDDMDGGLGNAVAGMALDGTTLWATQYSSVSKFAGGSWTNYAPPFGYFTEGIRDVTSVVIDNGILYLGGIFPIDSGIGPYGSSLYKYDIASNVWTRVIINPLTGGYSGRIFSLAMYNGYLYFGGIIGNVDEVANTQGIARWNIVTHEFSSVGGGIPLDGIYIRYPYSMKVVGADLIIGGSFPAIGDLTSVGRIVRWDGETFSKLETGLDGDVYAVTYDHNNLYGNIFAGGIFANAGDKPLGKIGEYINSFEALADHLENSSNSSFDMGAAIHGAPVATLTDDDEIPFWENTTGKLGKILWGSIKTLLNAIFVSLTGDQTIAGVKTFSSNPIILDEAYDAIAWDESLEPATKNAIRDKIETMSGGTPAGADTEIQFNDGGAFGGDTDFAYFKLLKSLNIGTILSRLSWGGKNKVNLGGDETDSPAYRVYSVNSARSPSVTFLTQDGTWLSATNVKINQMLGRVNARGAEQTIPAVDGVGTDWSSTVAEVRLVANENFTPTAAGTRVEIYTTPNGSETESLAATFGNDKSLAIVGPVTGSNLSGNNTGDELPAVVNDSILQGKASAWVARTMAQLKTDLVAQFTWAAFTPVWTQSATITKTIGYSKYFQLGKIVMFQGVMTATSAGTPGNAIAVTVPVVGIGASLFQICGTCLYYDASVNVTYDIQAYFANTGKIQFAGAVTVGNNFGTVPAVTVAAGDYIAWNIFYEVP
jgi:hypothetical protein